MSNYYKFGNVQVLDISRHLTSDAGQAVQYIARSCRLDGNNKGEVESDLRKAIDFLKDELDRVSTYENPENDNDWTEIPREELREALAVIFTELHDARVGTIKREGDGTMWTKSGADKWETFGTRQHGESTDDFGLAERIVCD